MFSWMAQKHSKMLKASPNNEFFSISTVVIFFMNFICSQRLENGMKKAFFAQILKSANFKNSLKNNQSRYRKNLVVRTGFQHSRMFLCHSWKNLPSGCLATLHEQTYPNLTYFFGFHGNRNFYPKLFICFILRTLRPTKAYIALLFVGLNNDFSIFTDASP